MDIKNIIVKEYLESLTEKNELNRIFPILLESMGFTILSKPTEYIGLQEYGKDIVAVGIDEDKVKKRFYFELKGGNERDITSTNFFGKDGIQDSISQASYNKFVSAFPEFDKLPLKIIIVHNGIIKGAVQSTLEGMFKTFEASLKDTSFERWDISRLTLLFADKLFGAYLLTDPVTTRLFNRILVNLNVTDGISSDYIQLINILFTKEEWKKSRKLPRKWVLLFESLKLIGFVIYTEANEYNNLEIAKRYITHLVLAFWSWILKNKLEKDKTVIKYFDQILNFHYGVLNEYFNRTINIAFLKDGLYSENGGRYEQIGYPKRTFEYLEYFCFRIIVERHYNGKGNDELFNQQLVAIINQNKVCTRPLIDLHSLPVISILNLFIEFDKLKNAQNYITLVLQQIIYSKVNLGFLPDSNNSIENVIKFIVTGIKPVYYSDSTSPLISVLLEYLVILNMEEEYNYLRDFIKEQKIDLGIFVPFHGINSTSSHLIEDKNNDLEEQLFSKSFTDGYQSETRLTQRFTTDLSFEDFKNRLVKKQNEFKYNYRTDEAGYPFLRELAHLYFLTPYFPDKWRNYIF
ncbi:hypothetical protein AR687_10800 [Flavobacteriaceae bacterium CRH]|nr:hypothetical protein AR687_10800 [Flavobacteriaceae bacterium CRH]